MIYLELVVLDGLSYKERVRGGGPLSQQHLGPIIRELTGLYNREGPGINREGPGIVKK